MSKQKFQAGKTLRLPHRGVEGGVKAYERLPARTKRRIAAKAARTKRGTKQ